MKVKNDCIFFQGDIPCKLHKESGVHCDSCKFYQPIIKRILIIKTGAAGDVIRTTPILSKIREEFPKAEINWLTKYPIFVPKKFVKNILKWNLENIIWLQSQRFDILINFDKDRETIALAETIKANSKKGYLMDEFGKCKPSDINAENKWLTGIYDDVSQKNKRSYPEEIFEICGFQYRNERYIFELPVSQIEFNLPKNKKIIGLNTGCGTRWITRLWGKDNWIELAEILSSNDYFPILLGGHEEDELNKEIQNNSLAKYLGYFKLEDFVNLMNHCHLVVTSVTMAMHIAIALKKKIVLFNNIFNKNEFELYGLGKILQPEGKDCLGCYKNLCDEKCMSTISPDMVFKTIQKLLK
jgi:heptosyltransferase-2